MLIFRAYLAGFLAVPGLAQNVQDEDFATKCSRFRPQISNSNFEFAEYLAAGSAANLLYRDRLCGGPGLSPKVSQDVCRLALYLKTSATSGVQFEAWIPKDWNGRFLATGNGGIGGCLDYSGLAYTTENGFAAVASNNGHNGTAGNAFYQNPGVVEDFAGRSLHTITEVGKDVTKQFYGRSHTKSYFLGCSQGGRQGIGAAEKWPNDFDGIVAGAPALDFNNLISWRASFYPITGPSTSPDFIKSEAWSGLIHDEVLRQCDALDGAADTIIESPERCQFRPEALLCSGSAANCLSAKQVEQVRKIFSPLTYPDGTIIYSAMQPGSEQRAIDRLYAGKPFSDSQDWFRYVIYSNPAWDPLSFTTKDAAASRDADPFNIKTYPSDLNKFKSTNGKLLMYHGLQDQQITSLNTIRWYEELKKGSRQTSDELDAFVRYFPISGMGHCAGGPGAWMIGSGSSSTPKGPLDSKKNVLAAIVGWVEQGIAPEYLEGMKTVDDNPNGKVAFTRRHCKYPRRNVYKGETSTIDGTNGQEIVVTNVDNWACI